MIIKHLFIDFIKKNKIIFIFFLILTLLTFPLESIIIPELYGKLYIGISNNPSKKLLAKIGYYIFIIIVIWILIQIFNYGRNYLNSIFLPKYFEYISKKLYSNLILNYETNYKNINITQNVAKIFDVTFELKDFFYFCTSFLLPLFLGVIVITFYLFYLDWKIGLIVFSLLFVFGIITWFFTNKIINISAEREKKFLSLNDKYYDSLENLMNIYLNSEIESELEKSGKTNAIHTDFYTKQLIYTNYMTGLTSVVAVLIFTTVIVKGYFNLKSGKFTGRKFITITLIIIYLLGFLIQITNWLPDEIMRLGTIKEANEFIEEMLTEKNDKYIDEHDVFGDIVFDNVSFRYETGDIHIFKNLSFTIKKGNRVAIVGSSGTGKSTIMQLILGLLPPSDGEILINNLSVRKINPRHLRKYCCFINQRTSLFSGTVLENIKYGNNVNDQLIIQILKKYDILKHFDKLDKGIYTDVGFQGKNLSGGMQKIVTNIRGLLKKSHIYIFDEPLSGLDVVCRKKMINIIKDLTQGKTLIIITHDKEIFDITDEIIDLNKLINKN